MPDVTRPGCQEIVHDRRSGSLHLSIICMYKYAPAHRKNSRFACSVKSLIERQALMLHRNRRNLIPLFPLHCARTVTFPPYVFIRSSYLFTLR